LKEKYIAPSVEIIQFDNDDVIVTSNTDVKGDVTMPGWTIVG